MHNGPTLKIGLTSTRRLDPEPLSSVFARAARAGERRVAAKRSGVRPGQTAERGAPKRERNAAETRRRILEAATAELAAKGYDGARLGTIARAAGVQQALIHHYFGDKEGLHAEVVRAGFAAMTEGVWTLLSRMDAPTKGRKRRTVKELEAVAEGFVDLILRFFAENRAFIAILHHDAVRSDQPAATIFSDTVGPVFEAIIERIDEMKRRGEIRKDVYARHLVLSCVAMAAFPFQEEAFVGAIWKEPIGGAFVAARKAHIVETILAMVLPKR